MGKSKKAKSERINALRTQYDKFLEDERKRKDRNDYIMGWLDKFQSSSRVSSIRFQDQPANFHHIRLLQRPQYEYKKQNISRLPNIKIPLTEDLEEADILKAVSQKYILIPKVTTEQNKNLKSSNLDAITLMNNDSDWTSKYNILDVLKQNEKEEKTFGHTNMTIGNECLDTLSNEKLLTDKRTSNKLDGETKSYKEMLFEQDSNKISCSESNETQNNPYNLCEETRSVEHNTNKMCDDTVTKCDIMENKDASEENICSRKLETQETMAFKDQHTINIKSNTEIQPHTLNDLKYNNIDPSEITKNMYDTFSTAFEAENASLPQTDFEGASNVLERNTDNSPVMEESKHYDLSPTEISDGKVLEEFSNVHVTQIGDNKLDANKEMHHFEKDPINTNDLEIGSKSHLEVEVTTPPVVNYNVDDQAQIEEFETEQKELFYSEEENINYSNKEEEITGEIYENNEHSYYEATKEDPNDYGTIINEHEESTEQYDPSYQQQFNTNTYEDNLIQSQYSTEEYPQYEGTGYQQPFYENYGEGQTGTNLETQQEVDKNYVYDENQAAIDNMYNIENYAPETISQSEELEHNVERQLNIDDGFAGGDQTVVANIKEEQTAQENLNADLNAT